MSAAAGDFERALAVTLRFEGGWYPGTRKGDPNPTMKGITQNTYNGWRTYRGQNVRSVRQIDDEELRDIYRRRFWDRSACGLGSWPMNLLIFDWAVNSGTTHAVKNLDRVDMNPRVYLVRRWAFLENLMVKRPATKVFRKGWARRVDALCKEAGVQPVAKEKP